MNPFTPHAEFARWDWYRTSIRPKSFEWDSVLLPAFIEQWPTACPRDAAPNRPFAEGIEFVDLKDKRLMLLSRGGDHVKGVVQLQSTGSNAPDLKAVLDSCGLSHEPSRVDACVDWFEDGLFDTLAQVFIQYAKENRLSISTPGDWARGEGRTLYIGSRSSPVMVRLYEKGYEERKKGDPDAPLNWVRFEVEVKFKKAKQRQWVATLSPADCFSIGWVHGLCERIMFSAKKIPAPSNYRSPDYDRALNHLIKQYGSVLARLADECQSPQEFMDVLLGRAA